MCDKAVDSSLLTFKFLPDWFVTNKIIEKLNSVVLKQFRTVLNEFWIFELRDIERLWSRFG